jgi:deaminated glutathione amidase
MTRVAAIQMISTPDIGQNMAVAQRLIGQARELGADMVLLPEYWAIMGLHEEDKVGQAEQLPQGRIQDFMADMARRHGVWLIGGTLPLVAEPGKVFNTTLVYDPQGQQVGRYDKIHLFGFTKGAESYDESRTIVPGSEIVGVELPFGLSVCYDLRFPELYRAMGACTLLVVPAAFTYTTGSAHWEILLRARAIENQCYVLASAQGGSHVNGRRTFGHSMLIDPWGKIIACLPEGEGVVCGDIEMNLIGEIRQNLPALKHRKL